MPPIIDRFHTLTASDLMARRVVTLSPEQSLAEAARVFAEHEVSSVPIVDERGICLGMLSAVDFLKPSGRGIVNATSLVDTVRSLMTSAVQSVAPHTPLVQLARMMSVERIHHLPVIERERVVGVVSSLDVVSAVVNAVEEADAR